MSLPSFLTSASIILCERVLQEKDDVISAIRLVDVFFVPAAPPPEAADLKLGDPLPPNTPVITFFMLCNFKARVGYTGVHKSTLKILNTRNEMNDIGTSIDQSFDSKIPGAPTAAGFIAQTSLVVRNLGTCYVCLFIDEQEVSRVPLTIALAPKPQ